MSLPLFFILRLQVRAWDHYKIKYIIREMIVLGLLRLD